MSSPIASDPAGRDGAASSDLADPVDADPLRYEGFSDDPLEARGLILQLIPVGARVLDIGCGTGSVSLYVRERRGADILGVEPNRERARAAAMRGLDVVHGVFDERVVERHGQFDVILFADVLEHLADPVALLRAVRPALRPGGRVVASIPNVAHWTVRLALLAGRWTYTPTGIMDATHLHWFTRAEVANVFSAAGYRIVALEHSAGTWLEVYERRPFRWLSPRLRVALVRRLARARPGLFGVQHVLAAEPLVGGEPEPSAGAPA